MSQFNTPTYDVERPTGQCAFTARSLEPNETYIATLVEVEREDGGMALKRIDVSSESWERGDRPENLFCFWKATVAVPEEKKKLLVDDEVLMNLFRRLEDADQDDRIAFRFVLALILMRKKLLRYEGSEKRADGPWWLLSAKAPSERAERERLSVLDPQLDEQRITKVTEQLGEILEAEL
jgi:hypothetical protein